MSPTKKAAIDAITSMPDDFTFEDILVELQLRQSFDEAEADVAAGRTYSHDEAKRMVLEWPKSSGPTAQ